MNNEDTIVALSTPMGIGAIGLIRLSGSQSLEIVEKVFKGRSLRDQKSHTLHLGPIFQGENLLDEVLIGIFKAPNSYTGQDVLEISCHGSPFIIQNLLEILTQAGARPAEPGEFTLRAFLNGKMDLSQSEAVGDLIASETKAMHRVAIQQMRGGFSTELQVIRQEILDFASLVELELDFSEEDVEFANRVQLKKVLENLVLQIQPLIHSFTLGNVLKKGVPVVIAGKPNAGKSTLLNALVQEERAIVSPIPGTTRDTIEVELQFEGVLFRLIDTAGLRDSRDEIEILGIEKTHKEMGKASVILYLFDPSEMDLDQVQAEIEALKQKAPETKIIGVAAKMDLWSAKNATHFISGLKTHNFLFISSQEKTNLQNLKMALLASVDLDRLHSGASIVTNIRHVDALKKTLEAVQAALQLLQTSHSGELLAFEMRQALYHLGTITGQVSNDELLGNIFSRFCIGK